MYSVLVVDDERWIRKGIVKMINAESLRINAIYEADSVTAALKLFERHRPDSILSDVIFPAENGCDFCEQVFSICPETRIVMISAFENFDYARRSIKFRAVDYLLKPVSKEQLNQVIGQCIEQLKHVTGEILSNEENRDLMETENLAQDSEKTSEKQIMSMMEHIRKNLMEKYTLAEMAAECCLSEVYFSNLFKKVSGMSPMNYITHVRIEKACELISSTNWRMVKIAQYVGYTDYQYFTKVFKKIMGYTPGDYKEMVGREFGADGKSDEVL